MAKVEIQKHRILREVYRHYLEFRETVTKPEHDGLGGFSTLDGVISHGYFYQPTKTVVGPPPIDENGKKLHGPLDKVGPAPKTPNEDGKWIWTVKDGPRLKVLVTFSFWDLHDQLAKLSPRKRQAVFYNVILDQKQKDVAKKMGITTVSVGQYVEQGMLQVADNDIVKIVIEEADG